MNKEKLEESINELGLDFTNLVDKHKGNMPPYEFIYRIISDAVNLGLHTAPNDLLAMELIMESIQNGIKEFKEFHREPEND
jgi:hypothetical protein